MLKETVVSQSLASELSEIGSTSFTEGLSDLSVEEVRSKRDRAVRAENLLSYVRRTLQARIDLLAVSAGHAGNSDRDLTGEVVRALGDHGAHGGGGSARFVEVEIGSDDRALAEEWLNEMTGHDAGVADSLEFLNSVERGISSTRTQLHGVIEVLSAEMVSRYKSGDATVESLLEREERA